MPLYLGDTDILKRHIPEIKQIEQQVFMSHKDNIMKFLRSFPSYFRHEDYDQVRAVENKSREILSSLYTETQELIVLQYVLNNEEGQ